MPMIYGIDPGFSGAIAEYDPEYGHLAVYDMPTIPGPTGKTLLNYGAVFDLLKPNDEPSVVWLEQVSAMPGQGVSSMFRFGQGYGALEMAIAGHKHVHRAVTPAKWKKHFGLTTDKGASRGLASMRFPKHSQLFTRVKDDGRAEAALIALYGSEISK